MSDPQSPAAREERFDERFAAMYRELRELAARCIVRDEDTLHPTALVHEAYLRCRKSMGDFDDLHLRAAIVTVMRHVLVDHARRRATEKRGGRAKRSCCSLQELAAKPVDLVDLEDELTALEQANPRMARIVELRVIGGFTIDEVAQRLEISSTTVSREWTFARAWLARRLVSKDSREENDEPE